MIHRRWRKATDRFSRLDPHSVWPIEYIFPGNTTALVHSSRSKTVCVQNVICVVKNHSFHPYKNPVPRCKTADMINHGGIRLHINDLFSHCHWTIAIQAGNQTEEHATLIQMPSRWNGSFVTILVMPQISSAPASSDYIETRSSTSTNPH